MGPGPGRWAAADRKKELLMLRRGQEDGVCERCPGVQLESSKTGSAEETTTRCQVTEHPLLSFNRGFCTNLGIWAMVTACLGFHPAPGR